MNRRKSKVPKKQGQVSTGKNTNTALHGIFPTSDHYHMTAGYASWDCGPWEKEGSELTWLSYLIDEGILIHSLVTFFKKTGDISTRGHLEISEEA